MTTRSVGKWKLPQPTDIKEENEWVQIPRIARTVPFGYKRNDDDPDILDPVMSPSSGVSSSPHIDGQVWCCRT